MLFTNAKIIGEDKIYSGEVLTKGNKIIDVSEKIDCTQGEEVIDCENKYLSPGFIDLHIHGGGGYSAMGSADDVKNMAEAHAKYGTTSILPTTLAAPIEQLKKAVDSIREAQKITDKANILGVHFEGPFMSPKMCGAQSPDNILVPSEHDYEDLLSYWDGIKMMGAAPETDGGMVLGDAIKKHGIVASIAHSSGDYNMAIEALNHGYSDITHLYNACTSCFKIGVFRHAGVVEAALTEDGFTAQVIADLCHLPLGVLKLIYKCKGADKMYLITDGLEYSALEMEEGAEFMQENGMSVVYEDGVMKLSDRSCLAGSAATMHRLVHNMYKEVGVPLNIAVKMASLTPAKVINIDGTKGKIQSGYDADLIIFDDDINVSSVYVNGKKIN